MNGLTIEAQITQSTVKSIERVLSGQWKDCRLPYVCISDVDKIMKAFGVDTDNSDFDTNGWQWDFWKKYRVDGKVYMLSGSGYYGGTTFGLNTDDEDEE